MKKGLLLFSLFLTGMRLFATPYYVNSKTGDDTKDGKTPATAWLTLTRVNNTPFNPGDIIHFAKGSSWTSSSDWSEAPTLYIKRSGTSGNPIIFRSYVPAGETSTVRPSFSNVYTATNFANCIRVAADYIIIEDLFVTAAGSNAFIFDSGEGNSSDNNIVRDCEITGCGVAFLVKGRNNFFTKNYIHDLIMVVSDTGPFCTLPREDPRWSRNPCDNDFGCTSFWFYGPNNEVSYNRVINNVGASPDYGGFDGGFLELYEGADNIYAHHNWVENGVGIVEGSNANGDGNFTNLKIVYNVFIENQGMFAAPKASGLLKNFLFAHNTCITKQGTVYKNMFQWFSNTNPPTPINTTDIKVRNNIFVLSGAGEEVTKNNNFSHTNNIYYLTNGASLGALVLGAGEKTMNPLFENEPAKDYRLKAGSPAIDAGADLGFTLESDEKDFENKPAPFEDGPDMGAYESPNNKLKNANMEISTDWTIQLKNGAASTLAFIASRPGFAGRVLKFTTTNAGTDPFSIQVTQPLAIASGKTYTISFKASAEANRAIGVTIQQNVVPYALRFLQTLNLTTTPTIFTYTFNSTVTDVTSLIKFLIGKPATASTASVYIDDVTVREVNSGALRIGEETPLAATTEEDRSGNCDLLSLYPNPVFSALSINAYARISDKLTITVYDMQGKVALLKTFLAQNNGLNTIKVNLESLTNGTYSVSVVSARCSKSGLVVVQK